MMTDVEAELRDRWAADLGRSRAATEAFDAICARYREPHRRYHGLVHVLSLLRTIDELVAAAESSTVGDPTALRVAAWFHDAVYDPSSHTNEADSATLAERELSALGWAPARRRDVQSMILATADHVPAATDDRAATAILLDADLAVLAADPANYQAYTDGVRVEYAHIDDAAWRVGRSAVLRSFLDRPKIFHTVTMHAREPMARANLTAELARWLGPASSGD